MHRRMWLRIWTFIILGALVGLSFHTASAETLCQSIQTVRNQPLGSTVTVSGVVTVASGTFEPNDSGFAIQAKQAGIYIHTSLDGPYAIGEVVRVTGVLENSYGEVLGVTPSSIERLGTGKVPSEKPAHTGNVNESTEGSLVRIKGTIVSAVIDDAPYGWKFDVDDGSGPVTVFIYTGSGIDVSALAMGQKVKITGFSGQFLDHYEVNPRLQSDIKILN